MDDGKTFESFEFIKEKITKNNFKLLLLYLNEFNLISLHNGDKR